jgi:hypothetical protein
MRLSLFFFSAVCFQELGRFARDQIDFSSCALSVVKRTGLPMASTLTLFDVGVIIFGE